MKVSKDKKFRPVTIVLETEKEFQVLWHRLNMLDSAFLPAYMMSDNMPYPKGIADDMWRKLNIREED